MSAVATDEASAAKTAAAAVHAELERVKDELRATAETLQGLTQQRERDNEQEREKAEEEEQQKEERPKEERPKEEEVVARAEVGAADVLPRPSALLTTPTGKSRSGARSKGAFP